MHSLWLDRVSRPSAPEGKETPPWNIQRDVLDTTPYGRPAMVSDYALSARGPAVVQLRQEEQFRSDWKEVGLSAALLYRTLPSACPKQSLSPSRRFLLRPQASDRTHRASQIVFAKASRAYKSRLALNSRSIRSKSETRTHALASGGELCSLHARREHLGKQGKKL